MGLTSSGGVTVVRKASYQPDAIPLIPFFAFLFRAAAIRSRFRL
ncbi:hypothetical protein [Streptomyces sp. NPDC014734]